MDRDLGSAPYTGQAQSEPELLPCPFCGDALNKRRHSAFHPTATVGAAWCWLATAGEFGGPYELDESDYAAWNRRALSPPAGVREASTAEAGRRHILKTWPKPFQAMWDGEKMFEVRRNDRGFQVGDTLELQEFEPVEQTYSGRRLEVAVTFLLTGGGFGVPSDFCVMSIRALSPPAGGDGVASEDARDSFEEWADKDNRRLDPLEFEERTPSNNHYYADDTTNHAYVGWCAVIARPSHGEDGVREARAADLGLVEYKCQHGKGDPPMDCIWPDCPCGIYYAPEYRAALLSPTGGNEGEGVPRQEAQSGSPTETGVRNDR